MPNATQTREPLASWLAYPIGASGTYGQHLYKIGYRIAAKVGRVKIAINPAKPYGFGDCDERGELGGLWFNASREMTDYDGVFSLGLEYAAAVEAAGFGIMEHATSDELAAEARNAGGFLALAKTRGHAVEVLPITDIHPLETEN
jgi:hypothetical protein